MTEDLDPITARAVALLLAGDWMAAEGKHPNQRFWRTPIFWPILLALLSLTVLAGTFVRSTFLQSQSRTLQTQNHQLQLQNRRILAEIRSCTTPNGKCAQRQAGAATRFTEILLAQTATIICAVQYPSDLAARTHCFQFTQKVLHPHRSTAAGTGG